MNNHEISVPHLDMTEDVKLAILEAIRSNEYYGYACVFYYMYMNDLALLSEDNDLWVHKIDTEDNKWVIVDKSFVVNLYKDSIIREFGKIRLKSYRRSKRLRRFNKRVQLYARRCCSDI